MEAVRYIPQYTIADYMHWEGDWELWRGVPVSMSPSPNQWHQGVAGSLYASLLSQLNDNEACDCKALYELDWHIDNRTVVRPDISIVCEPFDSDFLEASPTLVVEVLSPSTAHKDRTAKRQLYAEQGVAFYLMADPDTQQFEPLRLVGRAYEPMDVGPVSLELHEGCGVKIDPSAIWPVK